MRSCRHSCHPSRGDSIDHLYLGEEDTLHDMGQSALLASGLVFVCFGGAVFVRRPWTYSLMCRDLETLRTQRKYIGMLERLLIFILVLTNSLEGVTFLFAAKSITRYKRISEEQNFCRILPDRDSAQHYLGSDRRARPARYSCQRPSWECQIYEAASGWGDTVSQTRGRCCLGYWRCRKRGGSNTLRQQESQAAEPKG